MTSPAAPMVEHEQHDGFQVTIERHADSLRVTVPGITPSFLRVACTFALEWAAFVLFAVYVCRWRPLTALSIGTAYNLALRALSYRRSRAATTFVCQQDTFTVLKPSLFGHSTLRRRRPDF